jgi:general secretion pathway protein G
LEDDLAADLNSMKSQVSIVPMTPHQSLALGSVTARTSGLRQQLRRGFTLIELMVVLVILGVLAALIVPSVLDRADEARVTAAKTDINNIVQSLKLYKLDNLRYPSSEQGLDSLVRKPTATPVPPNWRPYLDKLPADPWGRPYQYMNPGVKGEIDVFSTGADGQSGGEGKNADIGSWQ